MTSQAAAAVTQPLTATIHGAPDSHDGRKKFTFELRFSEEFGLSFKTLRDHAFTVTGGKVVRAKWLEKGGNVRWEIHVRPSGDGTVTIVLSATTDCDATGAICTEDGRMLSGRVELTVAGLGGLSGPGSAGLARTNTGIARKQKHADTWIAYDGVRTEY